MFLTHTIETDGRQAGANQQMVLTHTIAGRRPFVTPGRFFCLSWWRPYTHYSPLSTSFHLFILSFFLPLLPPSFYPSLSSFIYFSPTPSISLPYPLSLFLFPSLFLPFSLYIFLSLSLPPPSPLSLPLS